MRLTLVIGGALLVLGGLGGMALTVTQVLATSYRRARLERLLDDPSLLGSIDLFHWIVVLAPILAVLLGLALIALGLRAHRRDARG